MKTLLFLFLISFVTSVSMSYAQDSTQTDVPNKTRSGDTKFLLAGKAQFSWMQTHVEGNPASHTFFPDALMLMPLVKLNNRLFLDAQIEIDANPTGGGAAINLNEMIVYYRAVPGLSIFAGNFSPKYGLFVGILDDFTNRYCTTPIGMARGPHSQTGIGIQGGIQAGYSKFNYQLYVANGPQLLIDSTTKGNGNLTGQLTYHNYADNNKNKAIGGSIGFLPLSNSNLQIDVSGQITGKTGTDGTAFQNISSISLAADMNYYHLFNPVMIRLQAEYNSTKTQNYNYPWYSDSTKTALMVPAFNNQLSGWYCGVTLRAVGLNNALLSKLELGGRISGYNPPKYIGAEVMPTPWGENPEQQTTICLTYWSTWKTPLNLAYDIVKANNGPTITTYTARFIYFF